MFQNVSKYRILLTLVLWTLVSSNTFAISDTIVTIKQLQFKTERAIEKQRYSKAIEYLNMAGKLTLLPKYWRFQSDVNYTKARLYYDLQFYQKAASEAEKAVENSLEENNQIKLAQIYNFYAIILATTGDYAESKGYLENAASIYNETNYTEHLAYINYAWGFLNFKLEKYPDAVDYFKKAIELYHEEGAIYMEIESYSQLSHALALAPTEQIPNSLNEAEKNVAILIELAKEHNFPRFLIESHRINQHVNIRKKDFEEAEKERLTYIHQRDSVRQIHLAAIENAVQGESEIGDLNKIIASQKDDIHRQEKTLFFGKLTGWLSIALIIILSLLTLSLYKNNNLRTKANELLQDKNTELQQAKENAEKASQAKAQFLIALQILKALLNNNKVYFEYDESIPPKVIGDSLKLSQILINLVSNSIKFTLNGSIWIRVQNIKQSTDKVTIHFEVEDTGDGVSKKKQSSIFESFSQGSLQINRKYGGTGLGLSIVKNLLNLMGSTIKLESKLGVGSKFSFDIEYKTILEDEKRIDITIPNNFIEDNIFENKKVLIVEDNKINQMITKKILEKKKMLCSAVDNGIDAVKMAREGDFDIILMDIHMPGISGIEATEQIREFNTNVVIIALTALTIEENLEEFYNAGFNEFIPKPFNATDFFEKIYRALLGNKISIK